MSSVLLCVNCKHYEFGPDLFPDSGIDHWCTLGIDAVTGKAIKVSCHESRSSTVPFKEHWDDGFAAIIPCGHQAKFFEPMEDF